MGGEGVFRNGEKRQHFLIVRLSRPWWNLEEPCEFTSGVRQAHPGHFLQGLKVRVNI